MAFPPAHLLVGFGVAEVVGAARPLPRWRTWAVAGTLAMLPDADIVLGIVLGRGGEYHGTFTHSVLATVLMAVLADRLGGGRWALLAGAGYGSHLLVDLLDARGRTNVLLAWPFSEARAVALAPIFPTVPFRQGSGPVGAAFSLLEPAVFAPLLVQTAIGVALFLGLAAAAWGVRRLRSAGGA